MVNVADLEPILTKLQAKTTFDEKVGKDFAAECEPLLKEVVRLSDSDCAVFVLISDVSTETARVTDYYSLVRPFEFQRESFPRPTTFHGPVQDTIHSLGQRFYKDGYEPNGGFSDPKYRNWVFGHWMRQKAWFPITLTVGNAHLFALVCLVRGLKSDKSLPEPFSLTDILSAWFEGQLACSRSLSGEPSCVHQDFLKAADGFNSLPSADSAIDFWVTVTRMTLGMFGVQSLALWEVQATDNSLTPRFCCTGEGALEHLSDISLAPANDWPAMTFPDSDEKLVIPLLSALSTSVSTSISSALSTDEETSWHYLPLKIYDNYYVATVDYGTESQSIEASYSRAQMTTLALLWSALAFEEWNLSRNGVSDHSANLA